MFLMTVNLALNICEVLVPAIIACSPLKTLFSQDELQAMWPQYEETRTNSVKKSPDAFMTGSVTLDHSCFV